MTPHGTLSTVQTLNITRGHSLPATRPHLRRDHRCDRAVVPAKYGRAVSTGHTHGAYRPAERSLRQLTDDRHGTTAAVRTVRSASGLWTLTTVTVTASPGVLVHTCSSNTTLLLM